MKEFEENVTFEDILNQTFKSIKVGSVVTGKIIEINSQGEIFVDIGYKADGIITKKEYSQNESLNPADEFKTGDKIKAVVLKMNDGQGNVLMSYRKEKEKQIKQELYEKFNNNEIFEEKVVSVNNNGLIVRYKDEIRIFIPMSLSMLKKDEDNSKVKGNLVRFKIIECDDKLRKIIGSIKDLEIEEKKEKEEVFWNSLDIGNKYKGIVTSLSDFGAFVDIGGAQGLLHISDMAWGRNKTPRDIFTVGQEIEVKIKELDKDNKRFKLSYEKKGPDPWKKVEEKYHIGDVVKVKVSKIMPFGAFVELEEGIEGLVHISQICEKKISKPEDELTIGKMVNAKIIDMNIENKKIELSIRELEGTSKEYKEE